MLPGGTAREFVDRIGRALELAEERGIRPVAGSGPVDLEAEELAPAGEAGGAPGEARHLESPPGARDPGRPDGRSRLRYFLDGVQSTREICRIGAAPVVATTVAAAIAERSGRRLARMRFDGPPELVRAVILPVEAGDERIAELRDLLVQTGLEPLGYEEAPGSPWHVLSSTEHVPAPDPSDYAGLRALAFGRARTLRERLETELLRRWEEDDRVLDNDDWLAADGQLGRPSPRAVGLVKSVARPEFGGAEAELLLDLAPGMRTTSFIPGWQVRRAVTDQRASWYVRCWPPQPGAGALGSLMRVEAARGTDPRMADEITRWILAERAPLAKPDPRWPAMIYPIHHVERTLKPAVQGSERAYLRLQRQLRQHGR
ncbi:hypothetical protein Rxyl_0453 [Rubrobacter xylanophilus DSM 9941]|uniref:NurA domain-containing protein n=1 Tax=Rubrobacter xylanophilus (strain DSM 9941 / JCM 11954 / NBRC 16129 / PRD-1) TaxID=266117 RepID=Q1AYV1_RUBXD|nr:hypothetical protein [Rubrobacter xylanophilus]ABG03427.1 hypothetical protein Rxyl_0453 [Rubrobacter xylanophilus DSM 9941]